MEERSLTLASSSTIRLQMLRAAGLSVVSRPARVDEETVRLSLMAEGALPRDVADTLAEMKARKVAEADPTALVLGCDQVLAFGREVWAKPETPDEALDQLRRLRGATHKLCSAAVLYDEARPVWRIVTEARLTMRGFSDAYLEAYVARNWDSIRHSVGGYKLEEEGVRLMADVQGDHFTVLGLPLIPLLGYLGQRGFIPA